MGACTSLPAEEDAAPPDDPTAESPTVVVKPVLKADIIAEAEVEQGCGWLDANVV